MKNVISTSLIDVRACKLAGLAVTWCSSLVQVQQKATTGCIFFRAYIMQMSGVCILLFALVKASQVFENVDRSHKSVTSIPSKPFAQIR